MSRLLFLYLLCDGDRSGVFVHPLFSVVLWDVGVAWCSMIMNSAGGQTHDSLGMLDAVDVGGWWCGCPSAYSHHSVVGSGG